MYWAKKTLKFKKYQLKKLSNNLSVNIEKKNEILSIQIIFF